MQKYIHVAENAWGASVEGILNSMNAIENEMPTTANAIGQAMQNAAVSSDLLNTSMDEFIALVTAAESATQQGGQRIGTALNAVASKYSTLLSGIGKQNQERFEGLTDLGVNIHIPETGELLSLMEVMDQIQQKWGTWTEMERLQVTNFLGGQGSAQTIAAIAENWDDVIKAQEIVLEQMEAGVEGSIFTEQEEAMQSMAHKMNEIQETGRQMWWDFADDGKMVIEVLNMTIFALDKFKSGLELVRSTHIGSFLSEIIKGFMQITMLFGPLLAGAKTLQMGINGLIKSYTGLKVVKTEAARQALIANGMAKETIVLSKKEALLKWQAAKATTANTISKKALNKETMVQTGLLGKYNSMLAKTVALLTTKKMLKGGLLTAGLVGFTLLRKHATESIDDVETSFDHLIDASEDFRRETDLVIDSLKDIRSARVESVLADGVAEEIKDVRESLDDLLKAAKEPVQKTYDDGSKMFEEGEPGPRGGATKGPAIMIEAGLDQEAFFDLQTQVAELADDHEIELEFIWNTPGELYDMLEQIEIELDERTFNRLEGKMEEFLIYDAEANVKIEELTVAIEEATNDFIHAVRDFSEEIKDTSRKGGSIYGEDVDNALIDFAEVVGISTISDGLNTASDSINKFPKEIAERMHDVMKDFKTQNEALQNGENINESMLRLTQLVDEFVKHDNEFVQEWGKEMQSVLENMLHLNRYIAGDLESAFLDFLNTVQDDQSETLIKEFGSHNTEKILDFLSENQGEEWTDDLLKGLAESLNFDMENVTLSINDLTGIQERSSSDLMNLIDQFMKQQAEIARNELNTQYVDLVREHGRDIDLEHGDKITTYSNVASELARTEDRMEYLQRQIDTRGMDPGFNRVAAQNELQHLEQHQTGLHNTLDTWHSDNQHHPLSVNRQSYEVKENEYQDGADGMKEADGGALSELELQYQELINEQLTTRGFLNEELKTHTDLIFKSVADINDEEEKRTAIMEQINRLSGENPAIQKQILSNMSQLHNESQANVKAFKEYQGHLQEAEGDVGALVDITGRLIKENEKVIHPIAESLGLLDDQEFKMLNAAEAQVYINELLDSGNLSQEDANAIREALLGLIEEELILEEELAELRHMSLEDIALATEQKIINTETLLGLDEELRAIDIETEEGKARILEIEDMIIVANEQQLLQSMEQAEYDQEELEARREILENLGFELDEQGNLTMAMEEQVDILEDQIEKGDIMVTTIGEGEDAMILVHDATNNVTIALDAVSAGINAATMDANQLAQALFNAGGAFSKGEEGGSLAVVPTGGGGGSTRRVADRISPTPSRTPTPRPSSRPTGGSAPSKGSGGSPNKGSSPKESSPKEEKVNDSTIDEAVWRFWKLENQIRRVNDEMNRLNNQISKVGNQMSRVDDQIARARLDENYAQVITLLERKKQLTNEQIKLERQNQKLIKQEANLQSQLRNAHRKQLDERVKDLEAHGFKFDSNGALLNYEHAKNFVGETAEEVEKMLNDWRSSYNTVRDLANTVDDLNQSLDDSNTAISSMELSLRQMEEEIRLANIEKELKALEGAFRRVELSIKRVTNVLSLQNSALSLLSSNDFELGQALHHHSMKQAQEGIRDLAEEFNYLIANQSEHEEVSEEVLSRLEELKGSMLENADAVIAYGIAINDLQLERSAADIESFTTAIDRNLNRMNALFSNIREGLLSGQSIDDLFADQVVGIEFNRGHNQFLPQFQQRIGMEETLQNSLDLFAQREIDRTKNVANEQLRIQAEKFDKIIAMQEGTSSSITSITGGQFKVEDWQLPGLNDYDIPDHLQEYFDVFDDYYAGLRAQRDKDLKEAGDDMRLRNEILEDFAIASMGAQQKLLEQAIAGNNTMIDYYTDRVNNAEALGLTGDQVEEYRQRIRDLQDANHDFQQQTRDTITAIWDLTFERLERVRREFDTLTEVAGHYLNILNVLRNTDPERELHVLQMMQQAELARNANLRDQRDELIAQREQVDYMSYEWRRINEQIEEMNSQLRDSDLTLLETNQSILEANIRRIFNTIEKEMFGKSQAEHERFMRNWVEGIERELELEAMARRIIDLERDLHEDEMAKLKEQFRLLEEQDKMSRQQMAYMNHHLTLLEE